ncbi:MAG TPA: GIY-YIG nuclease family protein, partial [Thermopetrobacter sp.]|nr:GIY-YIG nuclease family protein [Thermopetrobacter sp.]
MRNAWVYILASKRNGTLYVGVTSNLRRRIEEHRQGFIEGFTKRYGVKRLVWVERHESIAAAIQREKSIKKYSR